MVNELSVSLCQYQHLFSSPQVVCVCYTGVLTKPDRIPTGEEQNWLGFIRNEKEPLENNWFCVKQPSSNDLKQNWTWMQARQKEAEFFSGTSPWNELETVYARYLRTENLVTRLSQVLSDLIGKRYVACPDMNVCVQKLK